jgi:hypothetical protein
MTLCLKKMLADAMLAKKVLEYALGKNRKPGAQEAGRGSGRKGRSVLRAGRMPDPEAVQVRLRLQSREAGTWASVRCGGCAGWKV